MLVSPLYMNRLCKNISITLCTVSIMYCVLKEHELVEASRLDKEVCTYYTIHGVCVGACIYFYI